jgi:hypothetical protein
VVVDWLVVGRGVNLSEGSSWTMSGASEDAPCKLLAAITASQWSAWVDEAPFGTALHHKASTVYAC